jgi:DNA-binding transcriptional MerR regulator
MKTYTIKEVSKKINVPPGPIRQWEKEFKEVIEIPRSKQGARMYSDSDLDILLEIKQMFAKKKSKDSIRDWLQKRLEPETKADLEPIDTQLAVVPEEITPLSINESTIKDTDHFFEAMDTYKQTFLNEVKEEIRSVVRKEVLDEVKKEISKGTFYTVKSLSDSLYKSSANTKEEIQELAHSLEKVSELTTESLQYLSNNIANVSIETTEEIFTLSKQLSETSDELSHYVDVTNNEIYGLTEAITKDREYFIEEREQYRHEVRQREVAFQNMLSSYRDVAAAKEKKWWRFWS